LFSEFRKQYLRRSNCYEELAAIRVWSTVGHAEQIFLFSFTKFVIQSLIIN
jgi:hypothetical protein